MTQKISIETAYNVEVEYNLATVWDRIWGNVIDGIIKFAYIAFLIFLLTSINTKNFILIAIALLPYFFYSLFFEIFNNGQTPGKKAMATQVVSLDGRNLTTGQIVTRWFMRFLDFWILTANVAFLSVVSTLKAQRVGDMIASTTVITLKDVASVEKSLRVKLPKNYKGKHPEVLQLKEEEIELLKSIVRNKTEAKHKLQVAAANKLQEILGVPKEESSKDYLKKIIYDYNYFQMKAEGLIDEEE